MPEVSPRPQQPSADVRARLAADIAAGKTISLSAADLSPPEVREQLPFLLEELTCEATVASGLAVPGYTILATIGQGGMGTVYLARHEALGRHVALKVGTQWFRGDEKMRRRLLEEARLLARVPHPNIVSIHDVIEVNDTIAIAMEWVNGLTLAELLRTLPTPPGDRDMLIAKAALGTPPEHDQRFATTPVRFFVGLIHDVARALHCAHEAGMMHLDVKPSNVLLRRDGTPLLADFGVSRDLNAELVQTRSFAGTPVYCAPEQLHQGGVLGAHTDVYGLGMTLYEVLARSQPLLKLDLAGLIQTTSTGRMPQLSSLTSVARDLETVVHKAISPETAHRYPSAAAFADDLLAFLEHRPVSARPLTRTQRIQRWARHEPWKAALAVVLLLTLPTLIGLGAYLQTQLPRIEAQRRQEQRAIIDRLKQAAYRAYFSQSVLDEATGLLAEAMASEPGDTALACMLSLFVEEGHTDETRNMFVRYADGVQRHQGLVLLQHKMQRGLSFFEAGDLADLRASNDPVDHYVLALDRVFKAEDTMVEDDYAEAAARLADITWMCEADPMVFGLQGWCTLRAGHRQEFDDLCRAMEERWPDDPDVKAWHCITVDLDRPEEADRIAKSMVEDLPGNPIGWELFVGHAMRQGSKDLTERLQRAEEAGVGSTHLQLFRALTEAKGNAQKARAALDSFSNHQVAMNRRLELLDDIDPAEAQRFCEQCATNKHLTPRDFKSAYLYALNHGLIDLANRIFAANCELYPDRVELYYHQVRQLYEAKDLLRAALLVPKYPCPRERMPDDGQILCAILLVTRNWSAMRDIANRWIEGAEGESLAHARYFCGMAQSRLGQYVEAAQLLATATACTHGDEKWYLWALVELAWVKVAPDAPREVHDATGAANLIKLLDTASETKSLPPKPWVTLVRAEVHFANGDAAAARNDIEHLGSTQLELKAPANFRELFRDASKRYGK